MTTPKASASSLLQLVPQQSDEGVCIRVIRRNGTRHELAATWTTRDGLDLKPGLFSKESIAKVASDCARKWYEFTTGAKPEQRDA